MKKAERRPRLPKTFPSRSLPLRTRRPQGSSSWICDAYVGLTISCCAGQNQRQVKAIADAVEEALKRAKLRPAHVEGYDRAEWVLLDYFVHRSHLHADHREFYGLERLWGQAVRIVVDEPEGEATGKASGPARRA